MVLKSDAVDYKGIFMYTKQVVTLQNSCRSYEKKCLVNLIDGSRISDGNGKKSYNCASTSPQKFYQEH